METRSSRSRRGGRVVFVVLDKVVEPRLLARVDLGLEPRGHAGRPETSFKIACGSRRNGLITASFGTT